MGKGILEIGDNNFDSEVLQSDKPVLVDFWAPWCGPCKAIGPAIEKLAETYADEFRFTKCNVDLNPATPGKYGIRAIPTLMFFKQGQLVDKITGAVPPSKLKKPLKKFYQGLNRRHLLLSNERCRPQSGLKMKPLSGVN